MVDFLGAQEDIDVVGETASPQQGRSLATELQPDIALVDLDLGGQDGMILAEEIIVSCPDCSVVILSAYYHHEQMLRALSVGACGYLSKDIIPEKLMEELRRVVQGEMLYPKEFLIKQLKKNIRKTTRSLQTLTPREIEVLQLVTDGMKDKEAAIKLNVSEYTIKNHMKSVRKKLNVSNRVQATLTGIKLGIVSKRGLGMSHILSDTSV